MSLIYAIEQARKEYLKLGKPVERGILTTLVGEVSAKAKSELRDITDHDVQATIKKFIEGLDTVDNLVGVTEHTKVERQLLMSFMPTMMTIDEIKVELANNNLTTVKDAQQYMKAMYFGKYNPADVNKALK
jgi:hypothetical protein